MSTILTARLENKIKRRITTVLNVYFGFVSFHSK